MHLQKSASIQPRTSRPKFADTKSISRIPPPGHQSRSDYCAIAHRKLGVRILLRNNYWTGKDEHHLMVLYGNHVPALQWWLTGRHTRSVPVRTYDGTNTSYV